jgi:hypothetical protein
VRKASEFGDALSFLAHAALDHVVDAELVCELLDRHRAAILLGHAIQGDAAACRQRGERRIGGTASMDARIMKRAAVERSRSGPMQPRFNQPAGRAAGTWIFEACFVSNDLVVVMAAPSTATAKAKDNKNATRTFMRIALLPQGRPLPQF